MSVLMEGVMVLVVFGFIGILILQAIDDKDTDVTSTLEPYINFSSSKIVDITPRDFQMKNVNIEYFSGENKTIENNCKL